MSRGVVSIQERHVVGHVRVDRGEWGFVDQFHKEHVAITPTRLNGTPVPVIMTVTVNARSGRRSRALDGLPEVEADDPEEHDFTGPCGHASRMPERTMRAVTESCPT